MKIRITNYHLAWFVFRFIKPFWWNILGRGVHFNQVIGRDYKSRKIDDYYLLEFK
jgi:hypothetical protein